MRKYDCKYTKDYLIVKKAICDHYKGICSKCPFDATENPNYCHPDNRYFFAYLSLMQSWADKHLSISVFDAMRKVFPGIKKSQLLICPNDIDSSIQRGYCEGKYCTGRDECGACIKEFLDSPYTGPAFVDEQED